MEAEESKLQKNDIARSLIQKWINDKGYVVSFDGEIIIGIDKSLYADKLIQLMEEYHQSKLQSLKDPKKIGEIMKGSDFEHLKIEDEFGFTGEWRMSEKGVLDVIINLITNLEDK